MYEILAVLAAFVMLYSTVAGGVERTWISGPILFTAFGVFIGPLGIGLLSENTDPEALKGLAELTLALVLFSDAAGADLGVLRRFRSLPIRLLGIGLPLTILLGFGVGTFLFGELSVLEVALLATMLAPTDAALGKAVVKNESVPEPIREGLNVESGLNDGICVPILLLFLTLSTDEATHADPWILALTLFAEEVGIGFAVGSVVTLVGVQVLRLGKKRGLLSPTWNTITVAALAFTCFGTAQSFGGSGFIASFVGGLFFGRLFRPHHEDLLYSTEGIGDTFALLTWVLFGSAVVGLAFGQAAGDFHWSVVLYSLLSLTVIRMLPVFLSTMGLGVGTEGKLFLGWFGPRGLASIVFVVIVMDANLPNTVLLTRVVSCTVILSIIAHGITANPWARAYGLRAPHGGGGTTNSMLEQ